MYERHAAIECIMRARCTRTYPRHSILLEDIMFSPRADIAAARLLSNRLSRSRDLAGKQSSSLGSVLAFQDEFQRKQEKSRRRGGETRGVMRGTRAAEIAQQAEFACRLQIASVPHSRGRGTERLLRRLFVSSLGKPR